MVVEDAIRSISLPVTVSSVREARHFVNEVVPKDEGSALADAAALCVTELVANVVRHTKSSRCRLSVVHRPGEIRLEVGDDSRRLPDVRAQSDAEEGGRGLRIVQALAADWGVERVEGDGKTVWVSLR